MSMEQVRGAYGLLDCMERYVAAECKPGSTLAVMGSVKVTSNVFDSVVVRLRFVDLVRTVMNLALLMCSVSLRIPSTGLRHLELPPSGRWIAPHRGDAKLHKLPSESL